FFLAFALLFAWLIRMSLGWLANGCAVATLDVSGIRSMKHHGRVMYLGWSEVREIVLMEARPLVRLPRMLLVVPVDPAKYVSGMSRYRRIVFRYNWLISGVKWGMAFPEGIDFHLEDLGEEMARIAGVPFRRK